MNQDHAYIHREWHRAASTRDIAALIALYADDAILESPLVPAILDGKDDGVLHGKAEVRDFLESGARSRPIDLVRWHRSDTYFSAGTTLIWEYPRQTPEGDQVEIVEVMEITDRLIGYHRIYWGWKGFSPRIRTLRGVRAKLRPEPVREPLPPPKVYAPPRATAVRRRRLGR